MKGTLNRTAWGRQDVALALIAAVALLALACGGGGGVAETRAGYIAQIQSFAVQAPGGDEAMAADEPGADAEADVEGEGEGEGDMPAEPALVNVMLDILVHNEGSGTLDGITVDLTIADPDGMEKERRLLWIETAGLIKGSQSQVVHELGDVAYTEGDGFHVEVRHPIPMEERGDYREFDAEE
ncbi:MAG: hypothetical protein J4F98_01845 [Acidobacteria bacterium]|nr:hypothetical protein [Acidobacteriota bacterium]